MRTLGVVEGHPVFDDSSGLEAVLDFFEIDGLLLEAAPQPFDEDVVEVKHVRRLRNGFTKRELRFSRPLSIGTTPPVGFGRERRIKYGSPRHKPSDP